MWLNKVEINLPNKVSLLPATLPGCTFQTPFTPHCLTTFEFASKCPNPRYRIPFPRNALIWWLITRLIYRSGKCVRGKELKGWTRESHISIQQRQDLPQYKGDNPNTSCMQSSKHRLTCAKKITKTLKQKNLLCLLVFFGVIFVIYMEFNMTDFGKVGVSKNKSGHGQATAESRKTCSGICSANLLTRQPPRVNSTSVPSPSLAALWSSGHTAPLHPMVIYSTREATFCLP